MYVRYIWKISKNPIFFDIFENITIFSNPGPWTEDTELSFSFYFLSKVTSTEISEHSCILAF